MICDYLVVGAGFYGSVIAERIANDLKKTVIIIDKRPHLGGNCYSTIDRETGIEYHPYGPHIFHTSDPKVWEYICQFTDFNSYYHQVLVTHKDRVYQMPFNLDTINAFYGKHLKPSEAKALIQKEIKKTKIHKPKNLEEKALVSVGRPLYEAFIKEYTKKHWGKAPRDLPSEIIQRLPVRFDYSRQYFQNARWQGIPLQGYTRVFEQLLKSAQIRFILNCDYFQSRHQFEVKQKIIFTGAIDELFDYRYGPLEWRSVQYDRRVVGVSDYQGVAVMNYADRDVPYTRIFEPRHFHPERKYSAHKTLVLSEFSRSAEEVPSYPVNTAMNNRKYQKYHRCVTRVKNLIVGGRLGDYAYYDMDATISAALSCYEKRIKGT